MKAFIKAHVKTSYQYGSIARFALPIKQTPGGYFINKEFSSFEDAFNHLENIAQHYSDTEFEFLTLMEELREYNCLTIDNCTAVIEEE